MMITERERGGCRKDASGKEKSERKWGNPLKSFSFSLFFHTSEKAPILIFPNSLLESLSRGKKIIFGGALRKYTLAGKNTFGVKDENKLYRQREREKAAEVKPASCEGPQNQSLVSTLQLPRLNL